MRLLAQLRGNMVTPKRLSENSRHTFGAFFQVMRVVIKYRKKQKWMKKKLFYNQGLPGPDHLSTTERSLRGSPLFPQTILWASQSPIFFVCSTWYKNFGTVDRGKWNLPFDNFRQQIRHNSLAVETYIKRHCSTHCLNCCSVQVLRSTLRHAERTKNALIHRLKSIGMPYIGY